MTTFSTLSQRRNSTWENFCQWVTSTNNRLYVGWFGTLMIPCLLAATTCFIIAFIAAPPVDIDGIREPVSGSLLYGNNIISAHQFRAWEIADIFSKFAFLESGEQGLGVDDLISCKIHQTSAFAHSRENFGVDEAAC